HYVCSRSIARKALDEGVGILGDSLQSDQRFQASSSLLSLDVHSLLCIPLLGPQGSRLGVLQLDRRGHGLPFRTEDLQLLSTLGMLIAEILERAVREAERSPTEHQPPESALPRTGTSWPNASDYQDAMQHPARCFRDRWLRGCMAEKNTLGVAKPRAGTSAHVYKLQHGPEAKAVKVFLYPQREREERYQIISDYLKERGQPSCLVSFHYEPSGIRIHNEWYPVLTMDWVPGVTLETWIGQVVQAGDRGRLLLMAERWVRLVEELQAASICHGDLQHGNILVANDTPALMDYDTLCVPPLVGRDSLEEGRHGYQHPARRGQKLSLEMDHFSAWIIFIALRALAADLTLWDPYGPRQKICHLDGSWFSTDSSESRHIQVADLLA
ncbi:MAG TPA: GAF domain-containing protein, partial [Gemmataceae bacterium]|nr:GAF domain-containing protein [Gemmataceae bacterium]